MYRDLQHYALAGATGEAADHYNRAIHAFHIYRGDPVFEVDAAIRMAPDFPMAHILKAHLLTLATEPELTAAAVPIVRNLRNMKLTERETSHVEALEMLLLGRWTIAADALSMHSSRYPLDILALQAGHLIDFYRANSRELRDRPARVLPQWSSDIPGYSLVLGMYAFGLEETGEYSRAEESGREAVELLPQDCWAHHAVAHVYEMQGRAREGVDWMQRNEPHWTGDDNFFQGHNWWHYAVYCIEIGDYARALEIYDQHIAQNGSAIALDLVDASALLWRLHLVNVDLAARWASVADRWERHVDGRSYPFNDWHAVMANLGAGRRQRVQEIIGYLQRASSDDGEPEEWARRYGLPLSKGFAAFWDGDFKTAIAQLSSARRIANGFGGSHAQRDIIDLTLLEAALRGGDAYYARALANERCALVPGGRLNRDFLARSFSRLGHGEPARNNGA